MKRFFLVTVILLAFLGACSTKPEPVSEPEVIPAVLPVVEEPLPEITEIQPEEPAEEEGFDAHSIPLEVFNFTKAEIQALVEDLNDIIRAKNYDAWIVCLEEEYLAEKSSPQYLAQISEQPRLKSQNIVLTSPRDYFIHVVVPSRANDRVDDIEFVAKNRVKAYTINANGQRLRLYDLENKGNGWKIIN
ncbi:MAG: hypothetical protein LBP42_01855 [Treponema sp.]|jgi:hypothetical protein|nr:hypothetical protein [Treponema sp.]